MSELSETTKRLEPALRFLSTHPDAKVKNVASKYKISPAALWAWLGAHNHARPHPPAHVIDNCLADCTVPKAASMAATARQGVRRAVTLGVGQARTESTPETPVQKITGPVADLEKWLKAQSAVIHGLASTYSVDVTRELAARWLMLNVANRKPSRAKIRRFAAAMASGGWVQNGETIKFSASGRLIDGQSRLAALLQAENVASVILEVRGGLPDAAQQSMDSGEMRTGAHTLEMLGEKYPQILAPALKLLWLLQAGRLGAHDSGKRGKLENGALAPLLEKHPGLKISVGWVMTEGAALIRMLPASTAVFFHYALGRAQPKVRDQFFSALATGLNLTSTHAVYHLRERLQADLAARISRSRRREHLAVFVKAWNADLAREKVATLTFTPTEEFPVIAGLPGGKIA